MIQALLKAVGLFRPLFEWLKVDYNQLMAILELKLTLDNRRASINYRGQKSDSELTNSFLVTLGMTSMVGLMYSTVIFFIPEPFMATTLLYAFVMVMVCMTLITDFSAVILSTQDNQIILPRPVSSRTFFASRTVHIFIYLFSISLALVLFPSIFLWLRFDLLTGLLFLLLSPLATLFSVVLTNLFYLLVIRFSSEEKLKDVINYFQIGFSIFFMGGYQIITRLFDLQSLGGMRFTFHWWSYLIPPIWLGSTLEAISRSIFDFPHLLSIGLALLVPLAGVYAMNRYFVPAFTRKIALMDSGTSAISKQAVYAGVSKASLPERLSRWLTSSSAERGAFEMVWRITSRDRQFKLRTYPSMGYFIILYISLFSQHGKSWKEVLAELPDTHQYLFLLYLGAITLLIVLTTVRQSTEYKAAWIYQLIPIESPAPLLTGTFKAVFIQFFLPIYALMTTVILAIWGISVLDDIALGLINNVVVALLILMTQEKYLPFTRDAAIKEQSGSFVSSLGIFLLSAILGFIHYFLTKVNYVVPILILIQLLVAWLLYREYAKTSWRAIKSF